LFTSKFADNGQNSLPDCPYYEGRRRNLFRKGPSGHTCLVTRSHSIFSSLVSPLLYLHISNIL
jgi:hypothetical protein